MSQPEGEDAEAEEGDPYCAACPSGQLRGIEERSRFLVGFGRKAGFCAIWVMLLFRLVAVVRKQRRSGGAGRRAGLPNPVAEKAPISLLRCIQ